MKLIAQGAEASIYEEEGKIIKERKRKGYRLQELDSALRKSRTRREVKVFEKMKRLGLDVPELLSHSDKAMRIYMEKLDGKQLRDVLDSNNCDKLCSSVGEKIGKLHENNIIHGDLTTSNMILNSRDNRIYLIDFGLSFFSHKIEDKAVDLHVLKETLKARHNSLWQKCFSAIMKGYKKTNRSHEEVIKRLETVEARGRYKGKGS
jgi:Kae1-associated kinase Bud32